MRSKKISKLIEILLGIVKNQKIQSLRKLAANNKKRYFFNLIKISQRVQQEITIQSIHDANT
jgi:hypothetical protein